MNIMKSEIKKAYFVPIKYIWKIWVWIKRHRQKKSIWNILMTIKCGVKLTTPKGTPLMALAVQWNVSLFRNKWKRKNPRTMKFTCATLFANTLCFESLCFTYFYSPVCCGSNHAIGLIKALIDACIVFLWEDIIWLEVELKSHDVHLWV